MIIHVSNSYLNMARSAIDTTQYGYTEKEMDKDAMISLVGCTNVFSNMTLASFCAAQLHKFWKLENSILKKKYGARSLVLVLRIPTITVSFHEILEIVYDPDLQIS